MIEMGRQRKNGLTLYPQEFEPIRNFSGQDIISSKQFDRESLDIFYEHAQKVDELMDTREGRRKLKQSLDDHIIAYLFYEPSTRTRSMFQMAGARLGAEPFIETDVNLSSRFKGEPLGHTIRVLIGKAMADLVVIRDPQKGYFDEILPFTRPMGVPVFNGGDGDGEHPFQGLKDDYTWRKQFGTPEGRKFTFVGDVPGSRVAHSDLYLLSQYKNVEINLVVPPSIHVPDSLMDIMRSKGMKVREFESFEHMADEGEDPGDAAVIFRLQTERYKDKLTAEELDQLRKAYEDYRITGDWVKRHPKTFIYHPLPIERKRKVKIEGTTDKYEMVDVPGEITKEVDHMPQAKYFEQSDNGIVVSAAGLQLVLS